MKLILSAALAFAALPASAQQLAEVRRGPLDMRIKVGGTVVAEEVFRLKSTIDGRVEAVLSSSYTWAGPREPLALVVEQSLAALIDTRQTTPTEVLTQRWQEVYKPARIRCLDDCFVLAAYARPKKRVLPQAVLFEAAGALRLLARVRAEDRHLIREGQRVEFWPTADPDFVQSAKVERFVLDVQGQKTNTGGTFTARLNRKAFLDPGTQWEGAVIAGSKRSVLQVPTSALIRYKDTVFLPVRVSTGITTDTVTEITAGIEEKRPVLLINAAELKGAAEIHKPQVAPLPEPKPGTFINDGTPGWNRVLDDSPYDKPAGDEDE